MAQFGAGPEQEGINNIKKILYVILYGLRQRFVLYLGLFL